MSSEVWIYASESAGHLRRTRLDPSKFANQTLLAQLADLWKRHAEASGWSYGTASAAAVGVRAFVRFVDKKHPSGTIVLTGVGDRCGAALLEWRQSLRLEQKSDKAWRTIHALLKRASHEQMALQPTLALLTTQAGWSFSSAHEDVPLDEYSNAERIVQTRVATSDIGRCEARLARGHALYERDARVRELIALSQRVDTFVAVTQQLLAHSDLVDQIESILGMSLPRADHRQIVSLLGSLISPTAVELISFRVLLQWSTGLAPEQVRDATMSQIRLGTSTLYWASPKKRSRTIMKMNFDGTEPWTTVGLMQRVLTATSTARTLANTERIFTTFTVKARPGVMLFKPMPHPSPSIGDWFKHHKLSSTLPHDLRRIRKGFKAVKIGVLSSAEEAASPDHTLETLGRHYSSTSTSVVRAGRTVVRVQERVAERSRERRAQVISGSAIEVASAQVKALAIQRLAEQVSERSAAERSLTGSACSDPLASPFAEAGKWCTQAPFACLFCPNAVIFADHAPQLLLMRHALTERRHHIRPDEYATELQPQVQAIDHYLAQLSPDVIRSAESDIALGLETLTLPFPNGH